MLSMIELPRMASLSFWSFAWALIFECIGFAGLGLHTYDPSSRTAFLASFTAFNLTPVFLSIAVFMVFDSLITRCVPSGRASIKTICLPPHFVCPFLVIYELVAAGFIIAGLFHEASFLSTRPVRAIEIAAIRLSHQGVGAMMLNIGTIIQLVCLLAFAWVFTAALFTWGSDETSTSSVSASQRQKIFIAVIAITGLLVFSSSYKLIQYSGNIGHDFPQRLLSCHGKFPLFDASPQLLASFLFTTIFSEILSPADDDLISCLQNASMAAPVGQADEKHTLMAEV